MTEIAWSPEALRILRKLDNFIAKRILTKLNEEITANVKRYLGTLVDEDGYKIRVGDYRLFVDYDGAKDVLTILSLRHRRNAYKNM